MKILREKKRVTRVYERLILDDGFVFSSLGELIELLEELDTVDGYTSFVLIINTEWEKKLEEMKVIKTSNRGSSYRGQTFEDFYEDVQKTYKEYIEKV